MNKLVVKKINKNIYIEDLVDEVYKKCGYENKNTFTLEFDNNNKVVLKDENKIINLGHLRDIQCTYDNGAMPFIIKKFDHHIVIYKITDDIANEAYVILDDNKLDDKLIDFFYFGYCYFEIKKEIQNDIMNTNWGYIEFINEKFKNKKFEQITCSDMKRILNNDNLKYPGNYLYQLNDVEYLFFNRNDICIFKSDKDLEFYAYLGDSTSPYSYAVSNDYIYLLEECLYIKNDNYDLYNYYAYEIYFDGNINAHNMDIEIL